MRQIRIYLSVVAIILGLLVAPLEAVGTVTTTAAASRTSPTQIMKYTIAWTSSAGGAVSGNNSTIRAGRILRVQIIPNTAATQPTDLYDVTLEDSRDVDILSGAGANQSNAASELILFDPPLYQDDAAFELTVANAGNAKTGTVIVWVE